MNTDYFKYLLHTNRNLIAILFMACFLVYPFMIFFVDRQSIHSQALDGVIWYCFIIMILTFCIPVYMQNKRLKKRSVDTFYALPVRKESMVKTEMLFGLFLIFAPWIVNYFLGIAQYWIKEGALASGKEFIILAVCLIYGFVQYSINYFLAGKCNNTLDGIITIIAYFGLPVVIYVAAGAFIDSNTVGINAYDVINFSNMSVYGAMYSLVFYLVYLVRYPGMFLNFPLGYGFCLLQILLGIFACMQACRDYVKKPLEDAEQKTTSPWSYRFLIPVNCLLYLSVATYNNGIPWMVIVSVLVFLGYLAATFVSNRAIKITSRSVLFFAAVLLAMNVFTYIFRSNKAFGLNETFPNNYAYVEISLYLHSSLEDGSLQAAETIPADESHREIITAIQDLQLICIDRFYEGQDNGIGSIWVSYKDVFNKTIRSYNYLITKGDEKELIELLKKQGYEVQFHGWDTKSE